MKLSVSTRVCCVTASSAGESSPARKQWGRSSFLGAGGESRFSADEVPSCWAQHCKHPILAERIPGCCCPDSSGRCQQGWMVSLMGVWLTLVARLECGRRGFA